MVIILNTFFMDNFVYFKLSTYLKRTHNKNVYCHYQGYLLIILYLCRKNDIIIKMNHKNKSLHFSFTYSNNLMILITN